MFFAFWDIFVISETHVIQNYLVPRRQCDLSASVF